MKFAVKIDEYFNKLSKPKFVLIMVLCTYVLPLLLLPFFFMFNIQSMEGVELNEKNFALDFLLVVIVAPLIETFLFQTIFFWILTKISFFRERLYLIVIISSFFFGIAHGYSQIYIAYGFIGGLIFGYSYVVYNRKPCLAFKIVMSIHSTRNLIALIASIIMDNVKIL